MSELINFTTAKTFWSKRRVIVTGGAGFLGSFVLEQLSNLGAAEIIVPHIEEYDLTTLKDINRFYDEVLGPEGDSSSASRV